MPVLEYYEQMGMVTKIDGSLPIDEVWAGSQAAVTAYEQQLAAHPAAAAAPPRATYHVAIYAVDEVRLGLRVRG